jgi:hypothetical protein
MRGILLRFGWVRSIGASLTLAGVAVVFVVVILPTTAFGSSKSAKGGSCKTKFKSFSTDKAVRDDNSQAGVAIFGSNLDHVDNVQFKGLSGSKIDYINASTWEYDNGYIVADPALDSLGVPGKIRLVDTTGPGTCYAYSSSSYTPAHTS